MRDLPPAPITPARMVILALAMSPLLLSIPPASAQTHGDQRALDSLGPAHEAHHTATHSRRHAHPARATTAHEAAPPAARTAAAAIPSPPIPAAPPPPAVIKAPVLNVPLHPEPPPPPVPVVAKAVGASSDIKGGARITFGDGSADLNATTMQALKDFAARLKADPEGRAQIDAYSSGAPDDPSTPRRTSLERGLAARAVLINAGIPSTRIYVRVIGRPHDDGPADRVDLTRSDAAQPAAQTAAALPSGLDTDSHSGPDSGPSPAPAPVKAASAP